MNLAPDIVLKVIYIAGPFRASTHWGVVQNVRRAEVWGLEVAKAGHMPLIPHANTPHFHGLGSEDFWIEGTAELLRRCDGIIAIPWSKDSSGTRGELAEASRGSTLRRTKRQAPSGTLSGPG